MPVEYSKYTENENLTFKKFMFADNSCITNDWLYILYLPEHYNDPVIKPEITRAAIVHDKTDDKDHLYMNGDNKSGQLGNNSKTKSDE